MITTNEILALAPGPVMDAAIHQHVFGETGLPPAYSQNDSAGIRLLDRLPLFIARLEKPKDAGKPWVAGQLGADLGSALLHTTLTVSGPTMLGVLCRAALLVALKSPPAANPSPEPRADPAPVQSAKRPATKRANGAKVPVMAAETASDAVKPKQRPVSPIRQPSIFLSARSKLPPLPKRKPFVMPGDPAK